MKEHAAVHQPRITESYKSGRIGDVCHAVRRCQLHQRHTAACCLVDDLNGKRNCTRFDGKREQSRMKEKVHWFGANASGRFDAEVASSVVNTEYIVLAETIEKRAELWRFPARSLSIPC